MVSPFGSARDLERRLLARVLLGEVHVGAPLEEHGEHVAREDLEAGAERGRELRPDARASELRHRPYPPAEVGAEEHAPHAVVGRDARREHHRALAGEVRVVADRGGERQPRGEREALARPALVGGLLQIDALPRDERVGEAEAHVAHGGIADGASARERARAGAGLDERDRHAEIELETIGDAVCEEEVRVDLIVDRELIAACAARRRAVDDDRPRLVAGDQSERDLPLRDGLGAPDRGEALRTGVRARTCRC